MTKELRQAHPAVPWNLVIGMRNRLVHDYFRIDTTVVAEVVRIHIPKLKPQVEAILQGIPGQPKVPGGHSKHGLGEAARSTWLEAWPRLITNSGGKG
ncbi:MAG: DUF86 domain-containing protein [Flavobacteriales bacterium]|nr:DUF86 domain-containing protein [Flavobacteriales bacterium]